MISETREQVEAILPLFHDLEQSFNRMMAQSSEISDAELLSGKWGDADAIIASMLKISESLNNSAANALGVVNRLKERQAQLKQRLQDKCLNKKPAGE